MPFYLEITDCAWQLHITQPQSSQATAAHESLEPSQEKIADKGAEASVFLLYVSHFISCSSLLFSTPGAAGGEGAVVAAGPPPDEGAVLTWPATTQR